ncbi:MAG: type I-C CRISPR-associated protein Cas5c [Puniceicoccales bacterium]|jgi:CRISPR-associated protein Cas5d|nr:type I-C CRISPR-associated protein Cas5c [Puniceicoccales bacterium]
MPVSISIELKIWGDYAAFTAPETRVERLSYPVCTPSAARGVIEAIFWKPQIRYEIDRISVLRPIQFVSIRRNEIQDTIPVRGGAGVNAWMRDPSGYTPYFVDSAGRHDAQGENRTQRTSTILRDVAYLIAARLIVPNPTAADPPAKYREMFTRRAAAGQCVRQPALGLREFAAYFTLPDGTEKPVPENRDLGIMLYDLDYPAGTAAAPGARPPQCALFAPAKLENGVLDVTAMRQNLFKKASL